MDIMYTFLVDFARPQRTNELLVMQNDALTRVARFVLMNNGKALDVSDVDAVTINAVLPDESRITAEASLLTDDDDEPLNEIIYAIPASMTSAIGKTVVNISLYSNPENSDPQLLNSFEFYINTRNELNMDDGDDEDDYAGIRDLINRSIEAVALVEQLIARSTLPNPYPLRIILENTTYNYDGSHMVTVDFGNLLTRIDDLLRRIIALEQAFPDGCRIIARAITAGRGTYESPLTGVPTADNAAPSTMATNIRHLAQLNYGQGEADTKAIDPIWNTAFTSLTAGSASKLQTKCTKAGWTEINEIPASTDAVTTAKIDTTGDDQVHDFNIIPGVYNKAKVNQKPAYDAGHADGYQTARTGFSFIANQGISGTETKFLAQGTYQVNVLMRGYGGQHSFLRITKSNNDDLYYQETSDSSTGDHEAFSGTFVIGANAYVTFAWEAINAFSGFVAGGVYKI